MTSGRWQKKKKQHGLSWYAWHSAGSTWHFCPEIDMLEVEKRVCHLCTNVSVLIHSLQWWHLSYPSQSTKTPNVLQNEKTKTKSCCVCVHREGKNVKVK